MKAGCHTFLGLCCCPLDSAAIGAAHQNSLLVGRTNYGSWVILFLEICVVSLSWIFVISICSNICNCEGFSWHRCNTQEYSLKMTQCSRPPLLGYRKSLPRCQYEGYAAMMMQHPVQFKWVVDKRTGGNYGLVYPVKELTGESTSSHNSANKYCKTGMFNVK